MLDSAILEEVAYASVLRQVQGEERDEERERS